MTDIHVIESLILFSQDTTTLFIDREYDNNSKQI